MLGANLVSARLLFAAESAPAFDFKNLGPYLPYVIGGGFALVVIVVGWLMSRKSSGTASATDSPDGQPPDVYVAPNPLWKLAVPGVIVVALGAFVYFLVIPIASELSKVRKDNIQTTIKAKHEETMKAIMNADGKNNPFAGQGLQLQPAQLPQIQPQINIPNPKFTPPPPPRVPQVYVDSKGRIHTR